MRSVRSRGLGVAGAMVVMAVSLGGCAAGGASTRGMMPARGGGGMDARGMQQMTGSWAPAAQEAIAFMTQKYGPPAEMTATTAVWHRTGPWKRTVISSVSHQHDFPGPHPDVMEQFVDYRFPTAMFDELAMYDGSVVANRTKGELSARCDKEGANFLALNLAHEIATGARTPDAARRMYAEQIMKMKAGQPAPYTERLMFSMMSGTADPDRPAM